MGNLKELGELLLNSADKYVQIIGELQDSKDPVSPEGKKRVCALGMIGWEWFPDVMPNILRCEDFTHTENEMPAYLWQWYEAKEEVFDGRVYLDDEAKIIHDTCIKLSVTPNEINACLDGYSIIYANDNQRLTFIQMGEKFIGCAT